MDTPIATTTCDQRQRQRRATSRVVDRDYAAIAHATKQRIAWPQLLRVTAQWKWLENARNFSVYTNDDDSASSSSSSSISRFAVLATGEIRGTVHEVAALLTSTCELEFCDKMAALHGKEFKSGTYLADVPSSKQATADLSIRHATYASPGWLHRDDAWCYLDATTYDRPAQNFEKQLTTLKLEHVLRIGSRHNAKFRAPKNFHDVICGYRVQPTEAANVEEGDSQRCSSVRVHFYAEVGPPQRNPTFGRFVQPAGKHDASTKAIKQRLVRLAVGCDRLSQLVRRRRLGVQVLVDRRRLLPPTLATCVNCDRTKFVAKHCRVCGHSVCGDCSDKYERETVMAPRNHNGDEATVRVERVRVCDPCLVRVERADYSNLSNESLMGPMVFPDLQIESGADLAKSAAHGLKNLLHDALLQAVSAQRKWAVMSVIRSVLEQEAPAKMADKKRTKSNASSAESTSSSADIDCISALDNLVITPTPHVDVQLSGQEGRPYALNPNAELEAYPIPANEVTRIKLIDDLGILQSTSNDELDIICELAAKEMGAMASIVSIITADQQHVVAANNPMFRAMHLSREMSFCTHTIMDNKPLIVPHPEADYRLSHVTRMSKMGVRFYCGFPLFADDSTVIGTLCCVDQSSHLVTESQYSAMERLALTATRIILMQGAKNARSAS